MIYPNGRQWIQQSPHTPVHNITLATPPKGFRRDIGGVSAVGLGIANVHFDERQAPMPPQMAKPERYDPDVEGEDEMDPSDLDAGQEDDSDDEYVPGSKKKPVKKAKGKKGFKGKRKSTTK